MSDVRLTATNPVDSSVVPVSCNSAGELLVAKPVITEIDNDLTVTGNLTVGTATSIVANGPATFAGAGDFEGGVEALNFDAKRPADSTSDVFSGWKGSNVTSQILADGSATFYGAVSSLNSTSYGFIGENNSTAATIQLKNQGSGLLIDGHAPTSAGGAAVFTVSNSGSATFSGSLGVNGGLASNEAARFHLTSSATNGVTIVSDSASLDSAGALRIFNSANSEKVLIKTDGSATFAGNVSAPNINTFVRVLQERISTSESIEEVRNSLLLALEEL